MASYEKDTAHELLHRTIDCRQKVVLRSERCTLAVRLRQTRVEVRGSHEDCSASLPGLEGSGLEHN